MSLRYEQRRALIYTRDFLFALLDNRTRPRTVKELKERASRCLSHYPPLRDDGEPMWSHDKFRCTPK